MIFFHSTASSSAWTESEKTRGRLQEIIDAFAFGVALLDEELRIRATNSSASAMLGGADPVQGKPLTDFLPPEDQTVYDGVVERLRQDEETIRLEHGILRPNGSAYAVESLLSPFSATGDSETLFTLTLIDNERHKAEQERRDASEKHYRMLFETAADAMIVVSPQGVLLDVNDMLCSHIGREREELTGQDIATVFSSACRAAVTANIAAVLGGEARTFEAALMSPFSPIPIEINAQRITKDGLPAVFCVIRDITEHKLLLARLEYQASIDTLTTLHNRRNFLIKAEQEFLRFKRYGSGFAMLMLDLDYFKSVNDTYGHQVGDELLREFARQMRKAFRHSDILGRIGGEEFAVMLLEASLYKAIEAAERLRRMVEMEPLKASHGTVPYTVSIGATMAAGSDVRLETVMSRADAALYRAKRNGRNQVEFTHVT